MKAKQQNTTVSTRQVLPCSGHAMQQEIDEALPKEVLELPEGEQFLYKAMQEYYNNREFPAKNVRIYFKNEATKPQFFQRLWDAFRRAHQIDESLLA